MSKKRKGAKFPPKTWKGECDLCEWKFTVTTGYPSGPGTCPICGMSVRYKRSRDSGVRQK